MGRDNAVGSNGGNRLVARREADHSARRRAGRNLLCGVALERYVGRIDEELVMSLGCHVLDVDFYTSYHDFCIAKGKDPNATCF